MNEMNTTDQLIAIIRELSEDNQKTLLKFIENAGWQAKGKRKFQRKRLACRSYDGQDLETPFVIRNISVGGAYIETQKKLIIGQTITLDLTFSDYNKTLTIAGTVVRSDSEGFGVAFNLDDTEIVSLLQHRLLEQLSIMA